MNKIIICGRLGNDPEMKYFESGKVKTTFSLAVSGYQDKQKTTNWFNIECWDKQAEFVGGYFKKGAMAFVTGSIKKDNWVKEGEAKESYKIIADKIGFDGAFCVKNGLASGMETIKDSINQNDIAIGYIDDIKIKAFDDDIKETLFSDSHNVTIAGIPFIKDKKFEILVKDIVL